MPGLIVSDKKILSYRSLCETSETRSGAIFDPRAKILTILVEVHKLKLHTKYQRPGPLSFREKILKVFFINIWEK